MRWRGFTLIELMIVIAIIVFMAGTIVGALLHAQKRAENERIVATLTVLGTGLDRYHSQNQRYPGPPDFSLTADTPDLANALLRELVRPRTFQDRSGLTRKVEPALELTEVEEFLGDSNGDWDLAQPLMTDGELVIGPEIVDPWSQPIRYSVPGKAHQLDNPDWVDTSSTYDIWSVGRNGEDESAATTVDETDDWTNWFTRGVKD